MHIVVRLFDISYPLLYITKILFRITELKINKITRERLFCRAKVLENITNLFFQILHIKNSLK